MFVAIITALSVANAASGDSKKSKSFDLSQTAAVAPTDCLGCLEMRARQNMRNLYSLRLIPASVVSADPDPDPAKWKDPRSLSDFSRNSLIKLMRLLFNQINLYIKNNMLCCHKTRSPTVC